MKYMDTPGKCEEQNLEEFLTKWDLVLANLSHTKGAVFDSKTIAGIFLSKIRQVACLESTRDIWEDLNPEQWLRDRVELKLKRWRQDSNIGELYGEHTRTISSRVYIAAPAQRLGRQLPETHTMPRGRTRDQGTTLRWGHEGFA